MRLFLAGDVMTGRGIDQILAQPSHPQLYESWVQDARDYVSLAEAVNGSIPRAVAPGYIWGEALGVLAGQRPQARIINLETAITTADAPWPKGINYRMHPANAGCITSAGIHCCVLANNHVLDWGRDGLVQTLQVLHGAGVRTAGAGEDADAAGAPAVLDMGSGGRILVFASATCDSGVPHNWAAGPDRPGISLIESPDAAALKAFATRVAAHRRAGDLVIASLHWGGNWGFDVPGEQRSFARALVETADVHLVHGHSSHHVRGFEVYRGRLILYGCGDLLNDYEGIGGYERFRGDLGVLYFPVLDWADGGLRSMDLVPMRRRRFRLERAGDKDRRWLRRTLEREGARLDPAWAAQRRLIRFDG